VGEIEAGGIAVLRERARFGVRTGQTPPAQAALLLRRQVSQLPRWLGQARYNGPPPTHRGKLAITPRDHAANPAISADGTRVVYEAYRQNLEAAITYGEIAVMQRDLDGGSSDLAAAPQAPSLTTSGAALVSRPVAPAADRAPRPASAYNPTVSGDGTQIAFERAPGNNNFAKRYGRIGVFLAGPSGDARKVDRAPKGAHFSQSAYNPQLAADGRHLVFQAVRDGGRVGIYRSDLRRNRTIRVAGGMRDRGDAFADVYEPSVSADGRRIAYTRVGGLVSGGRVSSRVYVRDLRGGRLVAVSPAGAPASNPKISPDGRFVAYVADGALHVRDIDGRRDERVPTRGATPLDPQLSRGAKVVAFTAVGDDGGAKVLAYDRGANRLTMVAEGSDPSLSDDGTKIAFASRSKSLDPDKPDDTEGVFVGDLAAGRTTLVSAPSNVPAAPPKPPAVKKPGRIPGAARMVAIFDNQFADGAPVVRVRAGSVVGWAWRGNESHNVTVRRGAERFQTRTKAGGMFAHRFTRRGTYRIVCSLHSPGMGMKLVVS
jgi:Tol biopolymer transport system component/plastocyanin